ncbi:C3 and PZP-like alpha-2-macroglobulin domain-containing protein 8 isoform X2 [Varroa destructor]|uniref:CD109 antigen n=1 Tax=Varroa destructor TaxID=109461 RepID=A0A7M7JMC8_VARDE|nr:C3 and PZP-like alpha-2-macroglobulin domain-containing protein 8 isoform X2 [Varroa destructor]
MRQPLISLLYEVPGRARPILLLFAASLLTTSLTTILLTVSWTSQNAFAHWSVTHADYQPYHANPTHLVLCPRYIRQGQPYRFLVSLFQLARPVIVTATVHRDGVEIAKIEKEVASEGVPELITFTLPTNLLPGHYRLQVEGAINDFNGGVAFSNETNLSLLQRSLTIIVQIDRPLYRQGQTVKFRVIPVTTEFTAYQEALDIIMINPSGFEMKRWSSRRSVSGWLGLEYPLSELPQLGRWTIRVKANGYSHDEHFYVKEYYPPPFEVQVHSPSFIISSAQFLRGTVYANYSSGAPVGGNISVIAVMEAVTKEDNRESKGYEMSLDSFYGVWNFEFPVSDLLRSTKNVQRFKLVVKAKVMDARTSLIRKGYSESLIFRKSYTLRFEGPAKQVFKPGLPFRAYIELRYQDGTPVELEWFRGRPVSHYLNVNIFVPSLAAQPKLQHPRILPTAGTRWEVQIDVTPNWSNSSRPIFLEARFFDEYFGTERAKLVLLPEFSENSHHLSISTSTRNAKVGEFIIFHVRANYYVESFQYLVMSKGVIIRSGVEAMTSSIRTFAITLTKDMAPRAVIIVYDLTADDKLLADSLEFPVDGIAMNKVGIRSESKDRSGSTIDLTVFGDVGSIVGISSQPLDVLATYIHHPISTRRVSGLALFSDAYVGRRPRVCVTSAGYASCFDGSCYSTSKMCNGVEDCADGADEFSCHHRHTIDWEKFRSTRRNLVSSDFEATWLWKDVSISATGQSLVSISAPSSSCPWAISAVAISPFRGIYTLPNPEMMTSSRPFYMSVDAPKAAQLGEHFSARVALFNLGQTKLEVLVTLANSLDYKFVYVNAPLDSSSNGNYRYSKHHQYRSDDEKAQKLKSIRQLQQHHQQPITMYGEHQHLVFLWPQRPVVLLFPIVGIRPGETNLTVAAKTQTMKTSMSTTIKLIPEGFEWRSRVSLLVDIPRGAYVLKQLDTGVTGLMKEMPFGPVGLKHMPVGDYSTAEIIITGSAFGPPFATSPLTAGTVFGLPGETGEANMFSFAASLLSLQLLQANKNLVRRHRHIFQHLFLTYQTQLSYQRDNGGFAMFTHSDAPASVWLTALTVRYFHKANRLFPEWKNFVHIDHKVLEKALAFLLASQAKNGAFHDHDGYFTYDRKMSLKCTDDNHKAVNVSLTAYVTIALHELRNFEGPLSVKILPAIRQAQEYLEYSVTYSAKEDDPYQLAITAYALLLISSSEAEYAFALLDRKYIQDGDMRYWSKRRFQTNPSVTEAGGDGDLPFVLAAGSQPPQVTPLTRSELHAVDVETTAYALLAYLHGKAVLVKPIVEWLTQQRSRKSGWASTQDTIVAMEALLEYEKRVFSSEAEERELSMTITIEATCLPGISKQFHVSIANRYQPQRFRIPNAWGQLTVRARGVGSALLQIALSSRQHQPPPPISHSLSLSVKVFSSGRNHSRIHFRSCQSWLDGRGIGEVRGLSSESAVSGLVVLEAALPTGYGVDRDTLLHYVHSGTARNLRHAHTLDDGRAVFYFDYLDSSPICINFTALRLRPTAVVSRHTLVKVYEYHEPERLNQTLVDLSFLHALQVCDVCGSYQCVQCPSYNGAQDTYYRTSSQNLLVVLTIVTSLISHGPRCR